MLLSGKFKGNLPQLKVVLRPLVGVASNDDLPHIETCRKTGRGGRNFYYKNVQKMYLHVTTLFALKSLFFSKKNSKI